MIEAGILLGLSREVSTQLVVQTMLGTAKLLRDEEMHPVDLREAVTSPGGRRSARFASGTERCARRVPDAIQAAMERSQELAAGEQWTSASHPISRRLRMCAELLAEASRASRSPAVRHRRARTSSLPSSGPTGAPPSSGGGRPLRPPEHEWSNYGIAKRTLLDRIAVQPAAVHRIQGELGAERAPTSTTASSRASRSTSCSTGWAPTGTLRRSIPMRPASRARAPCDSRRGQLEPLVDRVTMTIPMFAVGAARPVLRRRGRAGGCRATRVRRAAFLATPASLVRSRNGETVAILDPGAAQELRI